MHLDEKYLKIICNRCVVFRQFVSSNYPILHKYKIASKDIGIGKDIGKLIFLTLIEKVSLQRGCGHLKVELEMRRDTTKH